MKLSNYHFGHVETDTNEYDTDIVVMDDWVHDWWRQDGHNLIPDDLDELLQRDPDHIVIGNGASGRMNVPGRTKSALEEAGVDVEVHQTDQAIDRYNQLQDKENNVAGAFHLTC